MLVFVIYEGFFFGRVIRVGGEICLILVFFIWGSYSEVVKFFVFIYIVEDGIVELFK